MLNILIEINFSLCVIINFYYLSCQEGRILRMILLWNLSRIPTANSAKNIRQTIHTYLSYIHFCQILVFIIVVIFKTKSDQYILDKFCHSQEVHNFVCFSYLTINIFLQVSSSWIFSNFPSILKYENFQRNLGLRKRKHWIPTSYYRSVALRGCL